MAKFRQIWSHCYTRVRIICHQSNFFFNYSEIQLPFLSPLFLEIKSQIYSVTSKKLPNVYKSCRKMISLEKLTILKPLQKLPKNVGDLGKLIVAKCFEKLPKVQ